MQQQQCAFQQSFAGLIKTFLISSSLFIFIFLTVLVYYEVYYWGRTKYKVTLDVKTAQTVQMFGSHLTAVWAGTWCRQEVKHLKGCFICTTHWKSSKRSMWNTADADQQGRPKTKGHLFFVGALSCSVGSLWAESRAAVNECVIVRLSTFDEQPPVILRQPHHPPSAPPPPTER